MDTKAFLNANIGLRDVIILGKDEFSLSLINQLKNQPSLGYSVIGYVSDRNDPNINKITPYLGKLNNLKEIVGLPNR